MSLIVTAFATLADVRGTLTPQLQPGDTTLILVDLGQGRNRMGGSMLAQVLSQFGDEVPDLDDPAQLKALVAAINAAARAKASCSPTTTAATAACGRRCARWPSPATCGVSLNVDMLVTEGDGIADSRAEYGDSKNWAGAGERAPQRADAAALFNEELGVVIQVPTARARRGDADAARARPGAPQPRHRQDQRRAAWSRSGATPRPSSARRCATCTRPGTR